MEKKSFYLEKMKIGLISDTHSFIDPQILKHLKDCDEIWHAGDVGNYDVIERLEDLAPVRAVYGNIDGTSIRNSFPEEQIFEVARKKIYMIHIGSYPPKYNRRIREKLLKIKPDIFICGHSHILKIISDQKLNLIHFNPGACGHHGFHSIRTMITFEIINARIEQLKVIELGKRGQKKPLG
jgi:hypothetical protein